MLKSELTPDPVRDAPDGHGDNQSPGAYSALPGRAIVDERFYQYPMTMVVLAHCCGHVNYHTAIFWINQSTLARRMKCTQQAISQHMRKLVQWGYIEKIRKEAPIRAYGRKGAAWRVIYDPRVSLDEALATIPSDAATPQQQAEEAEKTMELATTGPKGQKKPTKQPVDKSKTHKPQLVDDDDKYKPQLVHSHKVQLVHKDLHRTIDKEIKDVDCKRICERMSEEIMKRYGKGWVYDLRQMDLARQLYNLGYTVDSFGREAGYVLDWLVKNNKQHPVSLQYFIARKENKKGNKNAKETLKHLTNKMRFR